MSDRIAVFDDGIIQQLSTPDELYERPQNSFVAHFIGGNNTLHGTVTEIRNGECHVAVDGGGEVSALAVNVEGANTRTTLSLRPERAEIDPTSTDRLNTLEGRVEELIYLGDHIRTRLTVAGHDDFIVKVPNTHAHRPLKVGEAATVAWLTEDCRALDPIAR